MIYDISDEITAYYEKNLGWTDSKTGIRMISGISVDTFKAQIKYHLARYANTPAFTDMVSFYKAPTDLNGEGPTYPLRPLGGDGAERLDTEPGLTDQISAWWNNTPAPSAFHGLKSEYDLQVLQKQQLSLLAEMTAIGLTGWLPPAANNKAVQNYTLHSRVLDTDYAASDATIRETLGRAHYGVFVHAPDDVTAHAKALSEDLANGKIALALKRDSTICSIKIEDDQDIKIGGTDLGGKHTEIKYKDAGKTAFETPTLIYSLVVDNKAMPIRFDDSSDMTALLYTGMRAQGFNTSRAKGIAPNEPYTVFAQEYAARYTEARMSITPRLDATMAMQDLAQTVGYFKDSVGAIKKAYDADPAFKAKVASFVSGIDPKAMPTPEAVAALFAPPATPKPKAKARH